MAILSKYVLFRNNVSFFLQVQVYLVLYLFIAVSEHIRCYQIFFFLMLFYNMASIEYWLIYLKKIEK